MEYKKDIHSESPRFNGQQIQGQKNPHAGEGYGFIVRKAEKLTTALYLVTDILSDKEPMKWKAREVGVDILSDVTIAESASLSEKLSVLRIVLKKIERVVSFLDITASARMMSEMNASMLKKEYLALKQSIELEWSRSQERSKTLLNEGFFEVDNALLLPKLDHVEMSRREPKMSEHVPVSPYTKETQLSVAPVLKESRAIMQPQSPVIKTKESHVESVEKNTPKQEKESMRVTEQKVVFATPRPKPMLMDNNVVIRPRNDVNRDDRRTIILALIKQKPAITVGDIAKSIPAVSEKTIQRELLAMVAEGVLVKKGERRWSSYSLREG